MPLAAGQKETLGQKAVDSSKGLVQDMALIGFHFFQGFEKEVLEIALHISFFFDEGAVMYGRLLMGADEALIGKGE